MHQPRRSVRFPTVQQTPSCMLFNASARVQIQHTFLRSHWKSTGHTANSCLTAPVSLLGQHTQCRTMVALRRQGLAAIAPTHERIKILCECLSYSRKNETALSTDKVENGGNDVTANSWTSADWLPQFEHRRSFLHIDPSEV